MERFDSGQANPTCLPGHSRSLLGRIQSSACPIFDAESRFTFSGLDRIVRPSDLRLRSLDLRESCECVPRRLASRKLPRRWPHIRRKNFGVVLGGDNSTVESHSSRVMVAGSNPAPRSKMRRTAADDVPKIRSTGQCQSLAC